MKIALTVPQFSQEIGSLVEFVLKAEQAGVDGLFCFDHMWPTDKPGAPTFSSLTLLGFIGSKTNRIQLGTLVSRIGLLPDDVLIGEFQSLAKMVPGRAICGLGVGDSTSKLERERLGLPVFSLESRLRSLEYCASSISKFVDQVWLGGTSDSISNLARQLNLPVNLWRADTETIEDRTKSGLEVTWAGPLPKANANDSECSGFLNSLSKAGASWAVWAWPDSIELVERTLFHLRAQ